MIKNKNYYIKKYNLQWNNFTKSYTSNTYKDNKRYAVCLCKDYTENNLWYLCKQTFDLLTANKNGFAKCIYNNFVYDIKE